MEAITRNSTLLYKGLSSCDICSPSATAPCFINDNKANSSGQERKAGSKVKHLWLPLVLQTLNTANNIQAQQKASQKSWFIKQWKYFLNSGTA